MLTILLLLVSLASVKAGAPVFEDDPSAFAVAEDEVLQMRCSARGDPDPYYKWFDEAGDELGVRSYPPMRTEFGRSGGTTFSFLVFNGTVAAHQGLYTCTAENEHGLRSKIYNVTITADPGDDRLEILNVTTTSVAFRLNLSGNLKTLDIRYMEKVENMTLYRTLTGGGEMVFKKLIPSGHYTFNFTLVKSEEKKMWSTEVILFPDVPEVIYRHLADGLLTIEWFRTFDDTMRSTIDKYRLQYLTVQQRRGNYWDRSPCNATIEIPACFLNRYTLASLQSRVWYEIVLSAHTSAGYGEPYRNKVYLP